MCCFVYNNTLISFVSCIWSCILELKLRSDVCLLLHVCSDASNYIRFTVSFQEFNLDKWAQPLGALSCLKGSLKWAWLLNTVRGEQSVSDYRLFMTNWGTIREHINCRFTTANLRTSMMDFRGFDSSIILILRDGILRPMGNFPESLSQAILVGIMLGRLGVINIIIIIIIIHTGM